ncbi:uncharacterized protein LOC141695379 [Apium graveolens]|uniref:uncharacterized protein LOC141695379 n=1 Tax=Apium graveolens TaxID=4045 RepID=UPI003D78FD38
MTTNNSRKAYAREMMCIVREAPKCAKIEIALMFDVYDLEGLMFPHKDTLVITPIIENCPVKRVHVDNGVFMDIQFYDTFFRMGYNDSQLAPSDVPFYGFNRVVCKFKGIIQHLLIVRKELRGVMQMLNFQVVKEASTYNAIFGRIRIHAFKEVPTTYHMVLTFLTRNGIGEERGDQKMASSCYVASLRPDGSGGRSSQYKV